MLRHRFSNERCGGGRPEPLSSHSVKVCNLSGEPMATKVLGLVNGRLKLLYRKQRFLTYSLLCNAFIQPHYDYACSAWYPSLSKRLLKKSSIPK